MSPIIQWGYAPRPERKGSTRAQRAVNAQVLAEEPRCFYCGGEARQNDPLEVAHVVAWSEFGSDARENLRAAHRSCNRSRGNL